MNDSIENLEAVRRRAYEDAATDAEAEPCVCGHVAEEHYTFITAEESFNACGLLSLVSCECTAYRPRDAQDAAERADDAASERAERSRE